jgi:hypothetical protein
MVLLVAFSFVHEALYEERQSKCNWRLADSVLRVISAILKDGKGPVMVIAEDEIYQALLKIPFKSEHLVGVNPYQTMYMGSEGVWDYARNYVLEDRGITELVFVANPIYHLAFVKRFPLAEGYKINSRYEKRIKRVGYDRTALNRWARGPIRLRLHAIRQKLVGKKGL